MIAVIDYGAGNLRSITRALHVNGADTEVTSSPRQIQAADRIVLPGVGNARAAMESLNGSGIAAAVKTSVAEGTPLLGICLGMQLLFGPQEEGPTSGLAILPGSAKYLSGEIKVPHMGWNRVSYTPHSPLRGRSPEHYYFVHSYAVHPDDATDIAAVTDYGVSIPAIVVHNRVWGMQFHPEKSGTSGLKLLRAWLDWTP